MRELFYFFYLLSILVHLFFPFTTKLLDFLGNLGPYNYERNLHIFVYKCYAHLTFYYKTVVIIWVFLYCLPGI